MSTSGDIFVMTAGRGDAQTDEVAVYYKWMRIVGRIFQTYKCLITVWNILEA